MGCRGSKVQILSCRPKTHLNQPLTAGFFMSIFCTGNHWGKIGEKYRQKIRHNKLIATDPFVRLTSTLLFLTALYFQSDTVPKQ